MTLNLRCMACDATLTGEDEDELLGNVGEHVQGHGHSRPVTIDHIRSRLEHETKRAPGEDPAPDGTREIE